MFKKTSAKDLLSEFKKLRGILVAERDDNWVRGVEAIIEKLEWSLNDRCIEPYTYYSDACDTWKSMYKGNGSFSDYYIWRDDFNERNRLNDDLDNIKDNIWNEVNRN
jgi:hypothetical protein